MKATSDCNERFEESRLIAIYATMLRLKSLVSNMEGKAKSKERKIEKEKIIKERIFEGK